MSLAVRHLIWNCCYPVHILQHTVISLLHHIPAQFLELTTRLAVRDLIWICLIHRTRPQRRNCYKTCRVCLQTFCWRFCGTDCFLRSLSPSAITNINRPIGPIFHKPRIFQTVWNTFWEVCICQTDQKKKEKTWDLSLPQQHSDLGHIKRNLEVKWEKRSTWAWN